MPRSSQFDLPGGCVEIDDLVRAERPHRVVDGDERVAVSDLAACLDPDRRETRKRHVEPRPRRRTRRILVRRERLQARVERGAHDEELRALDQRERADGAQELLALDRLVRDDEDAALVRPTEAPYLLAFGSGTALAQVHGNRCGRKREEREEPERGRDRGHDHDEREGADRDQQEPERRSLAPKRTFHQRR